MNTWLSDTLGIDVPLVQAVELDPVPPLIAVMKTDARVVSVSFGAFEHRSPGACAGRCARRRRGRGRGGHGVPVLPGELVPSRLPGSADGG